MQTKVTDINWWADAVIGLLSQGEWKVLIFGLILTFAGTYMLKAIYKALINSSKRKPAHIRLGAIIAGFAAAYAVWEDTHAIGIHWYMAGVMLGPLSIALHHALLGISAHAPVKNLAPWLYPLLKGNKDRRKHQSTMLKADDKRR